MRLEWQQHSSGSTTVVSAVTLSRNRKNTMFVVCYIDKRTDIARSFNQRPSNLADCHSIHDEGMVYWYMSFNTSEMSADWFQHYYYWLMDSSTTVNQDKL